MGEASVSIRYNPFKGQSGPDGAIVPWSPYGRILSVRPSFTLDPLFHAGCYYVQDSSAMYVGYVFRKMLSSLGIKSRPRVLDLCAAPGGKTTDLATSLREVYGNDFLLVANEVMKQRSRVLADNVAIWGDPNVVVTSVDPAAFASLGSFFDVIVADVPCSGEGMFRKDQRAVDEWSEETVTLCAARQKRILADVWPSLKPGGALVYSTCTYERDENDANLLWAASELGGTVVSPENEFASSGVQLTEVGNLLVAGKVPGEGQWVGALVKNGNLQCGSRRPDDALKVFRPLRWGLEKGETRGKDFIPNPDWALSIDYDRDAYPLLELDLKTALHFLHRDTLQLKDAAPGYNAVAFDGHPLGFVKNVGNRCNNLHPQSRRILMSVD